MSLLGRFSPRTVLAGALVVMACGLWLTADPLRLRSPAAGSPRLPTEYMGRWRFSDIRGTKPLLSLAQRQDLAAGTTRLEGRILTLGKSTVAIEGTGRPGPTISGQATWNAFPDQSVNAVLLADVARGLSLSSDTAAPVSCVFRLDGPGTLLISRGDLRLRWTRLP